MKDLFEKINLVEATVVIALGGALVASIMCGLQEISLAVAGGLVAYLGHAKSKG